MDIYYLVMVPLFSFFFMMTETSIAIPCNGNFWRAFDLAEMT